jgi:hypothetical protein
LIPHEEHDGVEKRSVKSKAVKSLLYDDATRTLDVEFASASTYRYFDVPRDVYEWLLRVDSKGTFVNRLVKEKYRYERVDSGTAPPDDDLEKLLRGSLREPPQGE